VYGSLCLSDGVMTVMVMVEWGFALGGVSRFARSLCARCHGGEH
jgi:hypothetical protein